MTERSLTLELESALESLSKAVFSQPIDKTADAKISVRPLLLRGSGCTRRRSAAAPRPSMRT